MPFFPFGFQSCARFLLHFVLFWNWLKLFVLPWQRDAKTKHVCLLVLNQDFSCFFCLFFFPPVSCLANIVKQNHSGKNKATPPFLDNASLITHPDFFQNPVVPLNLLKHAPASNSLTNLNLSFPLKVPWQDLCLKFHLPLVCVTTGFHAISRSVDPWVWASLK